MNDTVQPLGIRNNNPGNLKFSALDKWQGLAEPATDGTFFIFKDAIYGIRALARTLIAYQDKHGAKVVSDFITRWAHPSENDTALYVASVVLHMKVAPTAEIDVHQYVFMRPFVEAIIQHENGGTWSDYYSTDQIDKAIVLAGVEPVKKALISTGQIAGGAVAAIAVVTPAIIDQLQQIHNLLQPYASANPIINAVCSALAVTGILYSMWSKYRERQKGIS